MWYCGWKQEQSAVPHTSWCNYMRRETQLTPKLVLQLLKKPAALLVSLTYTHIHTHTHTHACTHTLSLSPPLPLTHTRASDFPLRSREGFSGSARGAAECTRKHKLKITCCSNTKPASDAQFSEAESIHFSKTKADSNDWRAPDSHAFSVNSIWFGSDSRVTNLTNLWSVLSHPETNPQEFRRRHDRRLTPSRRSLSGPWRVFSYRHSNISRISSSAEYFLPKSDIPVRN